MLLNVATMFGESSSRPRQPCCISAFRFGYRTQDPTDGFPFNVLLQLSTPATATVNDILIDVHKIKNQYQKQGLCALCAKGPERPKSEFGPLTLGEMAIQNHVWSAVDFSEIGSEVMIAKNKASFQTASAPAFMRASVCLLS